LLEIIEECDRISEEEINFGSVRQSALSKALGITLLLDAEYIQEMASEIPQDLSGVVQLYQPFLKVLILKYLIYKISKVLQKLFWQI
jgi:hypothetical protein